MFEKKVFLVLRFKSLMTILAQKKKKNTKAEI